MGKGCLAIPQEVGALPEMVVYGSGIPAAAYPAEAATSAAKVRRYGVLARIIHKRFCYNRRCLGERHDFSANRHE